MPLNVSSTAKPSEEWLVKCPAIEHKPPVNMGDLAQNYADSLDQYFECANRHNAWIDFERKRK